ncbi:MAG: tRNA (N(6)-L-threonylcarbamoyladenosine(37)-C(2))-methylthiotransferase MtaB [Bacilli bacterium]|nr:tRNA (N(6)-L-threonylcarbamoyladenosine(37)-C(2))-methylthiotransferase MtaB [Bacilli bacterium]
MKVKAITLGCKVNAYESEFVLSKFEEKGYEITHDIADIYIINTCSVTNTSDAKSRKVINKITRENPRAIVVVMGCMIEAHKDYENDKVSIIIGNKDKSKVVELVETYMKNHQKEKKLYSDFDLEFEDMFIETMHDHTRAYVKIQDGCENFCSYCIIPYTRGRQRSKNPDRVIEEITTLVNNGYQEIVLTGIHTGHFGSDLDTTFPELLRRICKIDGLKRLRISSIEITELNDDFLNVLKTEKKIVNHMHIPLQAGSDTILKAMNRKYLTNYYREKINTIRSIRPGIAISTDVIVGFPSESEKLFNETLELCKEIEFSKIHVFPFSVRHGTKAETMDNQIPENIKKDRVQKLVELSNKLEQEYMKTFIGDILEVLVETNNDNFSIGHTDNFLKVRIDGNISSNKIVKVKIKKIDNLILEGSIYEESK